jgi:hypothetical protein
MGTYIILISITTIITFCFICNYYNDLQFIKIKKEDENIWMQNNCDKNECIKCKLYIKNRCKKLDKFKYKKCNDCIYLQLSYIDKEEQYINNFLCLKNKLFKHFDYNTISYNCNEFKNKV